MRPELIGILVRECGSLLTNFLPVIVQSRKLKDDTPLAANALLAGAGQLREDADIPENKATAIPTGCIPCSLGHLNTCSGLLAEAMRFARTDGVAAPDSVDRINMCLQEANSLERVDLRPEMMIHLPAWEKGLAEKALNASRTLRHRLEAVRTEGELEQAAAMVQTEVKELAREWYREKIRTAEKK